MGAELGQGGLDREVWTGRFVPFRGSAGAAAASFSPAPSLQSCVKGWCWWSLLCPGKRSRDLAFLRCRMVWDVAGCCMGRTGHRQGVGVGPAACGRHQQRRGRVSPQVSCYGHGKRLSYGPRHRRSWEWWEHEQEPASASKSQRGLRRCKGAVDPLPWA